MIRYEHRGQPVISHRQWLLRLLSSFALAMRFVLIALAVGVGGYHFLGGLGWVDALLEASMILSGMGPVAPMHGDAVKVFASVYALASGFVVLAVAGVMLAPALHRLMHRFHADRS